MLIFQSCMKKSACFYALITIVTLIFLACSGQPRVNITESSQEFHLYLLMGQSNMAGRGHISEQDTTVHPRVFVLNKDNEWVPARDPLHFDKPKVVGVGPGLTFGKSMADKKENVKIGLIPCAAGGSPISSWTKGGYHSQTKSYPYDNAIKRAKIAQERGVIKGILWHQGESDSSPELAPQYEKNIQELIKNIRTDLDLGPVPFVVGKLGDFYVARKEQAQVINDILENIPKAVKNTACVETKGLIAREDNTHFNTESARELGKRYAKAMIKLESRERNEETIRQ